MTITKTQRDTEIAKPLPVKEPVTPPLGEPVIDVEKVDGFDKSIRYVMKNETGKNWDEDDGSYTYNPNGHKDPPTKWGVILAEYQDFYGGEWTPEMVKAATREQALLILRKKFWGPIRGDEYTHDSVATAILDTAVNKGLSGCMVCLRDAVGFTYATAIPYGMNVVNEVNMVNEKTFLHVFSDAVLRYNTKRVEKYPHMAWALAGWNSRARRLAEIK